MTIDLASYIDHTLLKPEATGPQIDQLCREAMQHKFCAVCINPYWVKRAYETLQSSGVKVATVVGFPLGAATTSMKAMETKEAIANGADEIDMVINLGELKEGEKGRVLEDIRAVVEAAEGRIVKVIIETGMLTPEEMITACLISKEAGAHFVKTSTGFLGEGATIEAVTLMRRTVGTSMGVKASGGIRDREKAIEMIEAGASRIGTSSGIAILQVNKE